ncbi:MAG: 4Fe-4S binding protein [Bauldia sp.]|nr:4Fe-4S binding protein [Bauldia sp.]
MPGWLMTGSLVLGRLAIAVAVLIGAAGIAAAQSRTLEERATPAILAELFPAADRFGAAEGNPPFIRAFAGEEVLGYVFSTLDVVRAPSYSPRPFDAIVGMDVGGRLTGAKLLTYYDAYLTGFPQRLAALADYFARHAGYHVSGSAAFPVTPDFVRGATISARSMRVGILDAGRVILRANNPGPEITEPTLDVEGFVWMDWPELLAIGGIAHGTVTFGMVREAFAAMGVEPGVLEVPLGVDGPTLGVTRFDCRFAGRRSCGEAAPPLHPDDEVYTDLYFGIVTPALIGRNALGSDYYNRFVAALPPGSTAIALLSRGPYNYRGRSYLEEPGLIDRMKVVQGGREFVFHREDHRLLGAVYPSGQRPFTDASVFAIPPDAGFDPLAPFEVVLMVRSVGDGVPDATISFATPYQLPPEAVLWPYVEPTPGWVETWTEQAPQLAVLGVALLVLTGLFVFQKRLAMSRRAHFWVRTAFLVFTLVWIGWIAGAQLSIVHVVNYIKGPFDGAQLGYYLAEPLIVVLGAYVLLSLILIGRGVFCGWLCPFGALQELTARASRFLRLPTWNPSEKIQRWMWLPKYGTAALIVGTAFVAPAALAGTEEIEPFKTAITSAFSRPAPYVTYAVVLIVLSLFTERFFCRFLCPLGGLLALGDRLHVFTFLERRPECGTACHLCERSCPVRAIEKSGRIVMAECFQCLDCQVEYHDDRRCPPLAKQRKQRERKRRDFAPVGAPVPAMARSAGAVFEPPN